jgi:hypothetical protein
MTEPGSFNAAIDEHLTAIASLCRDIGSPQWANHITLILGDPHTLHGTVLWGSQDLDALRRLIDYLQAQAARQRGEEPPGGSPEGGDGLGYA